VPRETATSANARHECFVMDASVSVRTAETAEMDEKQERDSHDRARSLSWDAGRKMIEPVSGRAISLRPTTTVCGIVRSICPD
jgi:hypothetical protein